MSSPSPAPQSSVPQPLQDALDAHYRTLLAETQQIQLSSLSSSSTKLPASHSPRSTASTASSDLSPSLSPPSSPHRSPHSKRERVLTSLDDGDDPDALSSPTASVSPTLSSSSTSSLSSPPPPRLSAPVRSARHIQPTPTARVDSLVHLCTVALSHQLDHMTTLQHLPEEIVQQVSALPATFCTAALRPPRCALTVRVPRCLCAVGSYCIW